MARSFKKWSARAALVFLLPSQTVLADCFLVPTTHWEWRTEVASLRMGIIETDLLVEGEMSDHLDKDRRQVMLFMEPQSITLPLSLTQLTGAVGLAALTGIACIVLAFSRRNKAVPA